MLRCNLLALPVHAGSLAIVDLHAIHADVAFAAPGIARYDTGQSDETAPIEGPALEYRKIEHIEVLPQDNFFDRSVLCGNGLGEETAHLGEQRKHFEFIQHALRRFHLEQAPNALGYVIQILYIQSEIHAPLAAKLVH
jgi:hypothetical protein